MKPADDVDAEGRAFGMQDLADALPSTKQAVLEVALTFTLFKQLPAELRADIIDSYLMMEREEGRLSRHCHYDDRGSRCCVWEYPDLLITCDNEDSEIFPDPKIGRTPRGWMHALALTDRAMLGEVTVHMLTHTIRYDLKYIRFNHDFKIAAWFHKFLESIPGGDNTVQYLNFPHMHWFNNFIGLPAPTNPSLELMAACRNLRMVDMTFHSSVMQKGWDVELEIDLGGLTAQELVDKFRLGPIFECKKLEEVYFDGIYKFGGDSAHLDPLVDLAKWIITGFRDRDQKVQVEVGRRCGRWRGRVPGTSIELDDEVKDDVEGATKDRVKD